METTFNSAKNQYKANYIQHALTGEEKYKIAYETAQKTIESILEKAPEKPVPVKSTRERSFTGFRQEETPPSLPSQSWKYWTLGILLLGSIALAMF